MSCQNGDVSSTPYFLGGVKVTVPVEGDVGSELSGAGDVESSVSVSGGVDSSVYFTGLVQVVCIQPGPSPAPGDVWETEVGNWKTESGDDWETEAA